MATINHKTYNEGTETFKDFSVYDGKDTLIFKVDGADQTVFATNIIGGGNIKTSDNSALSGTAKYLSDGLGNDSALALSTSRVGIGTNSPASLLHLYAGNDRASVRLQNTAASKVWELVPSNPDVSNAGFTIYNVTDNTKPFHITDAGNVGIGTSAPNTNLEVRQDVESGGPVLSISNYFDSAVLTQTNAINFNFLRTDTNTNQVAARIEVGKQDTYDGSAERASYISFQTQLGGGVTERMRILAGGGLTFNGDTAAANALDDYEEGTFTPTIIGTTTAGTATYTQQHGRYTKIGRLVQFEIFINYNSGTGSGDLRISGLPFTIGGSSYPSFTVGAFDNITMTALTMPMAWGFVGFALIVVQQMPVGGGAQAGVAYDAAGGIQITGTYSV